jgi:hypothetical protein
LLETLAAGRTGIEVGVERALTPGLGRPQARERGVTEVSPPKAFKK